MRLVKATLFENTTEKGGHQCQLEVQFHMEDISIDAAMGRIQAFFEGGDVEQAEPAEEPKKRGRRRRKDVGGRPSDELDKPAETTVEEDVQTAEESFEEEEPEPAKPRRRRRKKAEEAEPEPEVEEEEEAPKPRRRRRKKTEEPTGPTQEDVAKAASAAAQELGSEVLVEIIMDYSPSGKLDDIPDEKRQEFIDDINNELSDED